MAWRVAHIRDVPGRIWATDRPWDSCRQRRVGGNAAAQTLARFDTGVPADSTTIVLFERVNGTWHPPGAAGRERALVVLTGDVG